MPFVHKPRAYSLWCLTQVQRPKSIIPNDFWLRVVGVRFLWRRGGERGQEVSPAQSWLKKASPERAG